MTKSAALRKVDARRQAAKPQKKQNKPKMKVVAKKAKPAAKPVKKAVAKKPVKMAKVAPKAAKPQAKPALKAPQLKVVKPQPLAKVEVKKPIVAAPSAPKKDFRVNNYVVYPTHGVGKIVAEETQEIAGVTLRLLVITFDKDKMTLRVPLNRAAAAGLRHVSSADHMKKVFETLKSKAKISRGMWSRRAQEYESKINSGNVTLIAEVVRDLHQNVDQAERSYSERMIYENALGRLVGELAAAEGMDVKVANDKVLKLLRAKVAAAKDKAAEAA